jgi:molybdenum cofactor biosynthesis enzyme MoaA
MNHIQLTQNQKVLDGLREMMYTADEMRDFVYFTVNLEIALLIIEIAKIAEDKPEWFPKGKWATIQNIQSNVEQELNKLKIKLNTKLMDLVDEN